MTPGDPRVPGDTVAAESLFAGIFAAVTIGAMASLAKVGDAPFVFPSLGPTVFLIFHRPTSSAASPRNAILSHTIGVLAGWSALAMFGLLDAPNALEAGVTWARAGACAVSLGITSGLMVATRTGHPPAGATTLIVSLGLLCRPEQLTVLLSAVVLACILGKALHIAAGTQYPWWSATKYQQPPSVSAP